MAGLRDISGQAPGNPEVPFRPAKVSKPARHDMFLEPGSPHFDKLRPDLRTFSGLMYGGAMGEFTVDTVALRATANALSGATAGFTSQAIPTSAEVGHARLASAIRAYGSATRSASTAHRQNLDDVSRGLGSVAELYEQADSPAGATTAIAV